MVFFLGLANILGGFIAVSSLFMDKYQGLKTADEKISPYKILIGLAILIIGVIKFIAPYHNAGHVLIPIFGDLIPSVLAMLIGIFISIDFLETLKGVSGKFIERLKNILAKYQYPIGFAGLIFGILHWILFKIIFF